MNIAKQVHAEIVSKTTNPDALPFDQFFAGWSAYHHYLTNIIKGVADNDQTDGKTEALLEVVQEKMMNQMME